MAKSGVFRRFRRTKVKSAAKAVTAMLDKTAIGDSFY
jgi:hypothetical protein